MSASLVAQMVKHLPAIQETRVQSVGSRIEENSNPFQQSCLENPMNRSSGRKELDTTE